MCRRTLIVAAITAVVVLASTAGYAAEVPPTYAFAGLAWGASEATVRTRLDDRYTFLSKDKDGDLQYSGTIDSEDISLIAYMSGGVLARVVVIISPDNNAMIRTYEHFKRVLRDKYGAPGSDDRYFSRPYDYGDGYEEQAVRNNKGSLTTKWPKASDGSSLSMLVFKSTAVRIFYDTPAGEAEEKARSARSTSDF